LPDSDAIKGGKISLPGAMPGLFSRSVASPLLLLFYALKTNNKDPDQDISSSIIRDHQAKQ